MASPTAAASELTLILHTLGNELATFEQAVARLRKHIETIESTSELKQPIAEVAALVAAKSDTTVDLDAADRSVIAVAAYEPFDIKGLVTSLDCDEPTIEEPFATDATEATSDFEAVTKAEDETAISEVFIDEATDIAAEVHAEAAVEPEVLFLAADTSSKDQSAETESDDEIELTIDTLTRSEIEIAPEKATAETAAAAATFVIDSAVALPKAAIETDEAKSATIIDIGPKLPSGTVVRPRTKSFARRAGLAAACVICSAVAVVSLHIPEVQALVAHL